MQCVVVNVAVLRFVHKRAGGVFVSVFAVHKRTGWVLVVVLVLVFLVGLLHASVCVGACACECDCDVVCASA